MAFSEHSDHCPHPAGVTHRAMRAMLDFRVAEHPNDIISSRSITV